MIRDEKIVKLAEQIAAHAKYSVDKEKSRSHKAKLLRVLAGMCDELSSAITTTKTII